MNTCDVYIIYYELCRDPKRVYRTNGSMYCIMYMICYIIFILLYSYVFIVDRYMRLKFRRSKCGNTHIQSNISACEEIVYIFLFRHSCKKLV